MNEIFEVIASVIVGIIRFFIELFVLFLELAYKPLRYIFSRKYRTQLQNEQKEKDMFILYVRVFGPLLTLCLVIATISYFIVYSLSNIGLSFSNRDTNKIEAVNQSDSHNKELKDVAFDFLKKKIKEKIDTPSEPEGTPPK